MTKRWTASDVAALKQRTKPVKAKPKLDDIDLLVSAQAKEAGWPEPEREVRLIEGRKFRWDYIWGRTHLGPRVALEINGGVFARGNSGHSSPSGIMRDYDKMNHAVAAGYRPLTLTPAQIREWQLLNWLKKLS